MSEHHPDHPADAAETPRIAAPSTSDDAPGVRHAAETAVARTEIAVDDLLREIGTLESRSPQTPATPQDSSSGWFTAAVAQLASGSDTPPPPIPSAPSVAEGTTKDATPSPNDRSSDASDAGEPDRADPGVAEPGLEPGLEPALESSEVGLAALPPDELSSNPPTADERPSDNDALTARDEPTDAVRPVGHDRLPELDELDGFEEPLQPPHASTDTPGAEPSDAPTSPPHEGSPDPRLHQMDGELAEGAEILLGANFETVNEVLESEAVPLGNHGMDVDPAPQPGSPPQSSVPLPGQSDERPPPEESAPDLAIPAGVPAEPADVAPVVSELIPPREPPQPVPSSELLPDRDPEDVTAPEPPSGDTQEHAPELEREAPPRPTLVDERPERSAPFLGRLEPPIVTVLRFVNAPLRRVPPGARPIVDWIALSLVFWVPIVWAVALLMVGR